MIHLSGRAARAGTRSLAIAALASSFAFVPQIARHDVARADGPVGTPSGERYRPPRPHTATYKRRSDCRKPKVVARVGRPVGPMRRGGTYNWPYSVTNKGPGPAADVSFKVRLNKSLKPVAASKQCRRFGGRFVCRIGGLKKGQTKTGIITTRVVPKASYGKALAGAAEVEAHGCRARRTRSMSFPTYRVSPATDLAVSVRAPGVVQTGQTIPYELTVTNRSRVPARDVVLSNGLSGRPPVRSQGRAKDCVVRGAGFGRPGHAAYVHGRKKNAIAPGTGFVCDLGKVAPGKRRTIRLAVRSAPNARAGLVRCLASVRSSTPESKMADNTASCRTRVVRPTANRSAAMVRKLPSTGAYSGLFVLSGLGLVGGGFVLFWLGRSRRRSATRS